MSTAEDVFDAPTLDAASLTAFIQTRWEGGNPYTMCKSVCVAVNPMKPILLYTHAWRHSYAPSAKASPAESAHVYILCRNAAETCEWRVYISLT